METFQFRKESIDPVRVGVVLDRLREILASSESDISFDSLSGMSHPELVGVNKLSIERANEEEVAKRLNDWCEKLEQYLADGGTVESFAEDNVWFIPLIEKAQSIQSSKED